MKNEGTRYLFMAVGCLCYALSLDLFLVPNHIVGGGVTGAATLISLFFGIPVGALAVLINLPILLMGFRQEGTRFTLRCFVTILLLGAFTDLLAFLPPITEEPLLAAMYGGLAQGIGIGLFIKYSVSSGGTELLGRILHRRIPVFSIPVMIALLDALVVVIGAVVLKNPENVLYALILIFLSAKVSDMILVGINHAKLCYIITDFPEPMAELLIRESPRGVTMLNGTGMYTKAPRGVLMTCIKSRQLTQFKRLIASVDKSAFVIIGETTEVLGKGFKLEE